MEKYKVSVVVPVYNGGGTTNFLHRQVKSVLNQAYKNIELILVNDGSTDDSLAICNEYRHSDDRVVVIDKPNGGESSARNAGIRAATGDYVSVIDQDDELDFNMYSDMMAYAEQYDADIIKCNFLVLSSNGRNRACTLEQPMGQLLDRKFLEENVIPYMIGIINDDNKKAQGHWTMIAKRSLLRDNNVFYEESLLKENDHRYLVNAFAYAQSAVFCEGAYYHWIKRAGSHTSDYSPRFWNILNNFNFYEKLFGNLYDFNNQEKIQYNVKFLIESLEYVLIHIKDCNARNEIISILKNETVKGWMELLQPETIYEKKLKNDILNQNYMKGFVHTVEHYIALRFGNLRRKVIKA